MSYFAINPTEIGARIRLLRKGLQKTQYSFADLLYISPSYLALIESGKRAPTLEVLAQVSKICNVSVDYLIFGDSSPEFDDLHQKLQSLIDTHPPRRVKQALQLAEYYLNMETSEDIEA